jgi:hypothetical protein
VTAWAVADASCLSGRGSSKENEDGGVDGARAEMMVLILDAGESNGSVHWRGCVCFYQSCELIQGAAGSAQFRYVIFVDVQEGISECG